MSTVASWGQMRNKGPRVLIGLLLLVPLFYLDDYYTHFVAYLSGSVLEFVATDKWLVVIVCIGAFVVFLWPLSFRRKTDWSEYGLVTAFFVSLFVEMFGIPLTIYLSAEFFLPERSVLPRNVYTFDFLGVGLGMDLAMLHSLLIMAAGALLIAVGWVGLYRGVLRRRQDNDNSLVTSGIYAYSRHPQYLGFLLIVVGWFIGWPSFLTTCFAPILVYKYVRVCRTEESEMTKVCPQYSEYQRQVPFFI